MTIDDPLAHLTLVVDAPDADDNELSALTLRLKEIVGEVDVSGIADHPVPPQPGSKTGAAMAINAVDVTARPGLLAALIDAVRNFVSFGSDRRVELAFQVGDRPLVVRALANELPIVLKALNEYRELMPLVKSPDGTLVPLSPTPAAGSASHSDGVAVEADEVNIEGSVVGRDQIWSAGGHIIIAKEGAHVIITGEAQVSTEQS